MTFFIALIFGLSVGTWVYSKTMRSTGNNYQSSLTLAGIVGVLATVVFYLLTHRFLAS